MYPAVRFTIAGRTKRFHDENDLRKAIRLKDIGYDTPVVYEAEPGHEEEMAARDCPVLIPLLTEIAGPEPKTPEAQPNDKEPDAPRETGDGDPPQENTEDIGTRAAASVSPFSAGRASTGDDDISSEPAPAAPVPEPTGAHGEPVFEDDRFEAPPKKSGGCGKFALFGLVGLVALIILINVMNDDTETASGDTSNICTASGAGVATASEADEGREMFIDRITNIRADAAASARKVGRAERGERFMLRRASEDSSENWYQILEGPHCGHFIYSYADTPSREELPRLTRIINKVQPVYFETNIFHAPDGKRSVGTIPASRNVSVIGYVGDTYAEVIDGKQGNILGYVERKALEKPVDPEPVDAGLVVYNSCPYRVRTYLRFQYQGNPVQGAIMLNPGQTYTAELNGRNIFPASNIFSFYSEADDPRITQSELTEWRPALDVVTAAVNSDGNYQITPSC